MKIATLALTAVLVCAGCDDGSADPGAACVESRGVCSGPSVRCGETLPYPCPGTETCCIPVPAPASPHDGGQE